MKLWLSLLLLLLQPRQTTLRLSRRSIAPLRRARLSPVPTRMSATKKAKPDDAAAAAAAAPTTTGERRKVLVLFDIDGTLTEPRKKITPEMHEFLLELKKRVHVGLVGGSDLAKQREQVGERCAEEFDYSFSENGLVAYKEGKLFHTKSLSEHLGEDKLKEFINYVLAALSKVDCPVKRGTFIEYRTGMLNVSPVGRGCSQKERDEFEKFDKGAGVRAKLVADLEREFGDRFGLQFSIGGQLSFDVFPRGWDKSYALQFVEKDFPEIHFFGDKTMKGGNDYEIFVDPRVKGHTVTSWQDTMEQCRKLFF